MFVCDKGGNCLQHLQRKLFHFFRASYKTELCTNQLLTMFLFTLNPLSDVLFLNL